MKLNDNLYFYPEKGMLDCNTYVIRDDLSIIIDPGSTQYLAQLVADLFQDGINPEDISIITNTHLHPDHCWANQALKNISGAKIVIHPRQKECYDLTVTEASKFLGVQDLEFNADSYLDNGKLGTGQLEFDLIHAPGHSPDSICFYCRSEKALICGDVIFDQNTGRVDLPGGSAEQLKQSILALSELDIEYLLPGHMNTVTGAEAVKGNFEFIRKYIFSYL